MRYLKSYKIFESLTDNQFFKTKEEIQNWLDKFAANGENIIINDDLTVDANFITIEKKNLNYIPIQFGEVDTFICSENNLTSLKGCPYKTNIFFSCARNKLTSLQYCPTGNIHTFNCSFNNILSTKYLSSEIWTLYCDKNPISEILNILPSSKRVKFADYLNEYDVIIDNKIYKERMKEVFYMMDIDSILLSVLDHLENYIIID